MPQYLESVEDAACDVAFACDKVGRGAMGIIPTTRENFKKGFFQVPLVLNHPSGMGLSVRSGYNSRGVNSTMIWNLYNIPVEASSGDGKLPANYNNIVIVGTTAQLKIGIGRSLAIDF
jgi:hypothetical protein